MANSQKKKKQTKKQTFSDIIGTGKLLKGDVLPSNKDIIRYYMWLEENCLSKIVERVFEIWISAGFNTKQLVTKARQKQILQKLHYQYRLHCSKNKSKKSKTSSDQREIFTRNLTKLFDIAACKCINNCQCLPLELKKFLNNQRNEKTMKIADINIKTIPEITQNISLIQSSDCDDETDSDNNSDEYISSSSSINSEGGSDYVPNEYYKRTINIKRDNQKYNTTNFKSVASMADRYGVSHQAAAAIASSSLQSVGLITSNNNMLVVDSCKIRRAREKVRENLRSCDAPAMVGLYFDGRKDRTLFYEKDNSGIYRKKFRKEEHISIIAEPGARYINHASLQQGRGEDIFQGISAKVDADFDAMGSDGTYVNTGNKKGAIRLYEVHLGHSVQWLICQLHFIELPLRALFIAIDGPTTGDKAFSGVIGKMLPMVETLPIVKFKPIANTLPELRHDMKPSDLSSDQQYLYDMCDAITKGHVSVGLANRSSGKLNHARWLTLANRCLRLYVASLNPSADLEVIVTYILKVYAPSWFTIKMNCKTFNGPRNLFYTIQSSRYLPKEYMEVVHKSIQHNAFYAHPENILLSMIHDENKKVRQTAYQRISEARKTRAKSIRKFEIPKLNFKAKTYYNLIDWNTVSITEPPLIKRFSNSDLAELVNDGKNSNLWSSPNFNLPIHTQAVERCVKIVTETSSQVAGEDRRDGYIRTILNSRAIMPQFKTKKEFKNH